MALAIAVVALVSMESCSKTQFQPGKLVGTWNMSMMNTDDKSTYTYPNDPTVDGDLLENVNESSYTNSGTANRTGTTSSISTYDGLGLGLKTRTVTATIEGTTTYTTYTDVYTDGTTITTLDTASTESNTDYSITFNKDKTFSITTKNMNKDTYLDFNAAYNNTYTELSESTSTIAGTWAFIGADKNNDIKNKERIGLWFTSNSQDRVETDTDNYVDNDADDFTDYTDLNSNVVYTSKGSYDSKSTEPDMVWEMIEGTKSEMKVTFMYSDSGTNLSTNTTTTGGTSVTTTTSDYKSTSESINTITFTK